MMKELLIGLLICTFLVNVARADHETDSIADLQYCNRVIDVFEQTPEALLDSPYTKSFHEEVDLGYSYSFVTRRKMLHYHYIDIECVYEYTNCISYRLTISVPYKMDSIYHLAFGSRLNRSNGQLLYGYWKPERAYQTMDHHNGANDLKLDEEVRQKFNYFLTPYSGLIYGYGVGFVPMEPENRLMFEALYMHMDSLALERVFSSLNPITRITGVEYYLRNKKKYRKDKEYYEKKIAEILAQAPPQKVGRGGCIVRTEKITQRTINQMMGPAKYYERR